MKQHVRIYDGLQEGTSLVGFSSDMVSDGYDEDVIDFISDRGYDYGPASEPPEDGMSFRYLEVSPPIQTEDIADLGRLCLQDIFQHGTSKNTLATYA